MKAYFGKSMYGGWYFESADGSLHGHANTLKELREKAKTDSVKLVYRLDN